MSDADCRIIVRDAWGFDVAEIVKDTVRLNPLMSNHDLAMSAHSLRDRRAYLSREQTRVLAVLEAAGH
jgi:hypothetical protein